MTGTIGSPPAKKPLRTLEPEGKKAPASKQKAKTKVVILRYSHGKGVGQKIDRILHSTKLIISLPSKVLLETQKPPVSTAKPPKTLHPLFLGKVAVNKGTDPQKPTQKGVIDLSWAQEPPRPRSRGKSSPTKPAPATFSGFGVAKLMKCPGAIEPAWPWRDMVHIRGLDPNEAPPQLASTPLQTRSRKFKYQAIDVSPAESILGTLANELCIEKAMKEIREINPDEYPPVPACLRIPSKHYEPGLTIQRRVLKELHTRPVFPTLDDQSSTEDEIQTTKNARRPFLHAALLKVYASIPKSFSAFDFGQCENQAWIQKYAPKAADEVLQAGSEARILKAWLQRLTVRSVEAGLGDQPESRAGRSKLSKSEKLGHRKRKSKKLDDFIVSTEDEDDDMDEVTESEDAASPNGKQDLLKKTVIRAGDAAALGSKEPGKLTNAILISGPHGCGKTAAVYAVAKELGFEVFEINSSSRRSGRDILERVGDMARNHQVQRSSDAPTMDPIDDDKQRIDDALANDLQSGRQGTMNSFFKPKQETKRDTKPKPKTKTETQRRAATQKTLFPTRPAKQQKQSLILLEEVDILYKEDTQFWAQVVSLISMSKRPIIMTCNDESVLPITSLSLTFHAILRFAPPPIDLAVDHMLLVAACEGHVLRRESVKILYEGRNSDLRASLTELQFWCQFAVGDVKRGLDWYYPRWSRREDIDEEGNTIRVVSEGTYETGMGWLSQDFLESDIHHLDVEEEMLHEVYDSWHADASNDAKTRTGMDRWAKKIQTLSSGRSDNKAALAMYADFAEAMSSADLCSGGIFAPDNRVRFLQPAILQLKAYSPSLRLHSTLAYLN
jgi:DNA polymerase III delta prime subunit